MPTDLEVRVWGEGNPERIVLLHGANVSDAALTWQEQRPLADQYELFVVSRRGFGGSPPAERITWTSELADILALVGECAHVVGHSYGAVEALLFAGRYPERVRSLVAIEPPAYGVALDDPQVAALQARLGPVHAAAPTLSPDEFLRRFVRALGEELPPDFALKGAHRKAVDATRRAPDPATAPLDLAALAAASFPKLIASGEWLPAIEAVCDRVAARIGADRLVVPATGHSPQRVGAPFNERLRAVFTAARVCE